MFDRFDKDARNALDVARKEAIRRKHDFIGAEHIMLGLLRQQTGVLPTVLANLKVDLSSLKGKMEKSLPPNSQTEITMQLPFTPETKRALEFSMQEANSLGHKSIGPEHLFLGLVRAGDGQAFKEFGVTIDNARAAVAAASAGKI